LPGGDALACWVLDLLGAAAMAELVVFADPGRGAFRYAHVVDGRLEACLFLAADGGVLPARDRLAAMLGTGVEPAARITLVAGRAAAASARPDPGPTICACFAVGLGTLQRAIAERRLTSLGEIGAALRAGTNCGSCLPELAAALLRARDGAPPTGAAIGTS
jgi:assimilatory nitrate reductase catalytic subunit